jgi:RNA polymerase sigma-70 factor, ECF subfamily
MAQAVSCTRWVRRRALVDEESWLAPARCGERWALERFYNSYRDIVYSVCFRLTGRAEDAEDATQAAFIRAFRELPRFRGDSAVKTWIYRIAVNESLTTSRR